MTDHIKAAAVALAQAEQLLQEANATEAQAKTAVSDIESKLEAVQRRKVKIRSDLDAETVSEAQAGGLFQIAAADESDLSDMKRAATERHGAAIAATREALTNRDHAFNALGQAERRQSFEALSAHVVSIEQTLTNAVAELFAMGSALGMPRALSSVWRPSAALRNAIALGVPPQKAPQ
jgi:hypothetical protein